MSKLLVIADDFTGALDTGVQFAKDGINSRVFFGKPEELPDVKDNEVLVYNTGSRHLTPEEAYGIVSKACAKAKKLCFTHVYKKTDSGLRGHIGAELQAAMDGFGTETLHFFPAYPKVNRVTKDGIHLIDGKPVNESVFGRDPFNPVTKSSVAEILAEETKVQTYNHGIGESGSGKGIHIHDAEKNEDFAASAAKTRVEELKVTSGCAGFAATLSSVIGLKGGETHCSFHGTRTIAVSGSINPVTQEMMAYADRTGLERVVLVGRPKADKNYFASGDGDQLVAKALEVSVSKGIFIIDVGPKDEPGHETEAYVKEQDMTFQQLMDGIADNLGALGKRILDKAEDTVLLCIGGDTLSSTVSALGIDSIKPVSELYPGVVLTEVNYGGKLLSIITKSGGFGDVDLLEKIRDDVQR